MTKDFLNFLIRLHLGLGDAVVCTGGFFGVNDGTIRKDSFRVVVNTFLLYTECRLELLGSCDVCKV